VNKNNDIECFKGVFESKVGHTAPERAMQSTNLFFTVCGATASEAEVDFLFFKIIT